MNFGVITPIDGLEKAARRIVDEHPMTLLGAEIYDACSIESLEWLVACCRKALKRYGGLDLQYLHGCSVAKQITLAARKRLHVGRAMADDASARAMIVDYVVDCL